MPVKSIKIIVSVVILIAMGRMSLESTQNSNSIRLLTKETEFIAGDTIELEFSSGNNDVSLYCSNSFGSIIVEAENGKNLIFKIPEVFSKKSGTLNWKLISESSELTGHINILPKQSVANIETYIGPPSIEVGPSNYSMMVTIPIDEFDNPLKDSTQVQINHQFLDNHQSDAVHSNNGIAYKNISSYNKSGRIILSAQSHGVNSKEFDITVYPSIATDFDIKENRIHNYTDGNQIMTLSTSVITDTYENIVSDGTLVYFTIENNFGHKTTTTGASINGIATAKVLHPSQKENWTITANVSGFAKSNSIALVFEQAVSDFEITFKSETKTLVAGPIKSFMGQYIPDGLDVNLSIYNKDRLIFQTTVQSVDGIALFDLNNNVFPKGKYDFKVMAAGISKELINISL